MTNRNGIEFRELNSLDLESLPNTMYQGVQKRWSNMGLYFPKELIGELTRVVQTYLRVMGLDETKYPARVDLGFSPNMQVIIYEITTGFVDQVGSCLSLQGLLGDQTGLEALSQSSFESSVLTSEPYRPEYNTMKNMFEVSGKPLKDEETDSTFVYGYPKEYMKGKENYIPGWIGLSSEEKLAQGKVLSRIVSPGSFIVPRFFSANDTRYEDLPESKNTKLVFKQNAPKIKGDRNTIVFGKGRQVQEKYEEGAMLAQEYIPAFRDNEGKRFEAKALFMPTPLGTSFVGMYNLLDSRPQSKNIGNTSIPNDGYPQGPGIIIP